MTISRDALPSAETTISSAAMSVIALRKLAYMPFNVLIKINIFVINRPNQRGD
jgi:hypothetical protein